MSRQIRFSKAEVEFIMFHYKTKTCRWLSENMYKETGCFKESMQIYSYISKNKKSIKEKLRQRKIKEERARISRLNEQRKKSISRQYKSENSVSKLDAKYNKVLSKDWNGIKLQESENNK